MWSQAVTRKGRDTCQCAETIRMPRASGWRSPNAPSAAAWASPPNADMGDPCPTKTAGFRIVSLWPPYQNSGRLTGYPAFRGAGTRACRVENRLDTLGGWDTASNQERPQEWGRAGRSACATSYPTDAREKCRLKFRHLHADEYDDRYGRKHSGWHRQRTPCVAHHRTAHRHLGKRSPVVCHAWSSLA